MHVRKKETKWQIWKRGNIWCSRKQKWILHHVFSNSSMILDFTRKFAFSTDMTKNSCGSHYSWLWSFLHVFQILQFFHFSDENSYFFWFSTSFFFHLTPGPSTIKDTLKNTAITPWRLHGKQLSLLVRIWQWQLCLVPCHMTPIFALAFEVRYFFFLRIGITPFCLHLGLFLFFAFAFALP